MMNETRQRENVGNDLVHLIARDAAVRDWITPMTGDKRPRRQQRRAETRNELAQRSLIEVVAEFAEHNEIELPCRPIVRMDLLLHRDVRKPGDALPRFDDSDRVAVGRE